MSSITEKLIDKKLISPPSFLKGSILYECIMGSEAYGCATDLSDRDIYGFCIPPKAYVFPHTAGEIAGFSTPKYKFDQFNTERSIIDGSNSYDIQLYSIIKYFKLVKDNNPNMIDSLYVPERCITQLSSVGKLVRDNREIFLHKGMYHKFCGYAHSSLYKLKHRKHIGLEELKQFEMYNDIDSSTTFNEVILEIKKRKLDISNCPTLK